MPKSKVHDVVNEVQTALSGRLNLNAPRFALEQAGEKVSGSIISESFRGMKDSERQRQLWDALEAEYGPHAFKKSVRCSHLA